MNNNLLKDKVALGLTLFATFFGAGNLIFPPYLGLNCGSNWWIGFLFFMLIDVVLSVFALKYTALNEHGVMGILAPLGEKYSKILLFLVTICIGPLVAIPRTGATTIEMGVMHLIPGANKYIATIIFFGIALFFAIKPGKIVDIIGLWMTPILLVTLSVMIVLGIISPIGDLGVGTNITTAIESGISSGYQTMDSMASLIIASIVLSSLKSKHITDAKERKEMINFAGILAGVLLALVYGGLSYVGAYSGTVYNSTITQTELMLALCSDILGPYGSLVLGIAVSMACMTTAIGLISSCADYVKDLLDNKVSYNFLVILFTTVSAILCNFGVAQIISLAGPILELLYPLIILLILIQLNKRLSTNANLVTYSCALTFGYSFFKLLNNIFFQLEFVESIPFYSMGLDWIWVALIGLVCSNFIHKNKI